MGFFILVDSLADCRQKSVLVLSKFYKLVSFTEHWKHNKCFVFTQCYVVKNESRVEKAIFFSLKAKF